MAQGAFLSKLRETVPAPPPPICHTERNLSAVLFLVEIPAENLYNISAAYESECRAGARYSGVRSRKEAAVKLEIVF